MRKLILLSFLVNYLSLNAQQSIIRGVVSIHNSETKTGKRQFVVNAQVEDDLKRAQSTITDINGQFSLIYVGIPEQSSVHIQVKKTLLEVVNISSLNAVAGQTELIRISMAPPDSINEYRRIIYNIGKTKAERRLEVQDLQKSEELTKLRMDGIKNALRIKQIEQELLASEGVRKKIEAQAHDLAHKYAPVNLDDASPLFRKTFLLFQEGLLDSALLILTRVNLAHMVYQILSERKKLADLQLEVHQRDSLQWSRSKHVAEALRFKRDLHKTVFEFDSTAVCFELLLKLDSTNFEMFLEYADFLAWINRHDQAIYYYNKVLAAYKKLVKTDPQFYESRMAFMENSLGSVYAVKNDFVRAEGAYLEALKIYKRLFLINPADYKPGIATIKSNLGGVYTAKNDFARAEQAYREALEIFNWLSKSAPTTYDPYMASTQNNLGVLFMNKNDFVRSESAYQAALGIYKRLIQSNRVLYEPDVAMAQNNLGDIYVKKNDFARAEAFYLEAFEIYKRLAQINPATYEPHLATAQGDLGILYVAKKDFVRAESAYLDALEIRKRLSQSNPAAYEPKLAIIHNNLGILYAAKNDFVRAEAAYMEALEIYKRLSQSNPETYEPFLASTKNNLGGLYTAKKDFVWAEIALLEALEIYKRLSQHNPITYDPGIATIQGSLGILYGAKKDFVQAEAAFLDALKIRKRLALSNPGVYAVVVAKTQHNLGNLYVAKKDFARAEVIYRESLEICKRLILSNPSIYEFDMIVAQNSLGRLYVHMKKFALLERMSDTLLQLKESLMKAYPEVYTKRWTKSIQNLIELYSTILDTIKSEVARVPFQQKKVAFYNRLYKLDTRDKALKMAYASSNGYLSWYLLFVKHFKEAERFARKGLELDKTQVWIRVNLAHALLLQNKYEEALKVYQELKFLENVGGQTYVSICLLHFGKLEKEGFTNTYINRIREFLESK